MPDYPDPEHNPKCQCWPNLMKAFFCQFGHMTECHYPMTCREAECSHYEAEMANEAELTSEEDIFPESDEP